MLHKVSNALLICFLIHTPCTPQDLDQEIRVILLQLPK